ncbi:MAG: tetratricopeptide repeat protein, partial [Terrimicrobiaceae bacterium]
IKAELQRSPQSSVLNFLEGKVYAAQGEWNRAESSLTHAIALDPNFASAYSLLISSYLARNELPQAIAQLQTVLAKNPKDVRALMLSAIIYEKMSDFSAARDAYEKLLSVDPSFAPALNNLAYLYAERLKDLDKALELAQKARTLLPSNPAVADTLGWILYKRADYQQALTLLQESAQNLPHNAEIQFHLGMANYSMGRTNEARAAFGRAVVELGDFPGREEAQRRLALLENAATNEAGPFTTELEGILKEKPDDVVATIRLAESYEKKGAFAQAATAYEEALKHNPKLLSATGKLAELNAGPLQDNEKALRYARIARELAPNDPQMERLLGRIAYQAGNFSWAYSLLQESARRLPNDPKALHDFGWSAYSLGKVNEARLAMQRVLEAAPQPTQSNDAKLFLAMTAPDEKGTGLSTAESEVDEVLKEDQEYIPALMARAEILRQRGENAAAASIYSEVLRRFPDFAPAQKRLASMYAEDPERRHEAYDLAMKARRALPDDPELAQILAELSYQRKEFAYAVQLLRQSSEKKPLDAKSLYYLGLSQLKANDKQQSREALQGALAAGLPDPLASEARNALAELEKN